MLLLGHAMQQRVKGGLWMSENLPIKLDRKQWNHVSLEWSYDLKITALSAKEKMFTLNCFKVKRRNYIIKFNTITTYSEMFEKESLAI